MRSLISIVLLFCCLYWLPVVHAEETESGKSQASAMVDQEKTATKEKKDNFTLFWIVFAVSILFVISSATALNRMGGKPPSGGKEGTPSPRKKPADDERRFRL